MSRLIFTFVAVAMLILCGVLQPEQAWAQTACTTATKGSDNTYGTQFTRYIREGQASDLAGGNGCGTTHTTSYNAIYLENSDFIFYLPAPTGTSEADGATDPVIIVVENSANVDQDITEISCPGGTVGGVGTARATILLSDGNSCTLQVLWDNGGTPITFSGGRLTNNGGDYEYDGGGVISGEDFGGVAIALTQADGSVAENVAYTSPAPTLAGGTPIGVVSYSLGGADAPRFSVDASTGVVSMAARDFEVPADTDSNNAYVYTLTVTDADGNMATTQVVTVTVTDAAETATISLAQADGSVAENAVYTSQVPTVTGTPVGGVSYSLGGTDGQLFTVDASTGVVSMVARDFEAPADADSDNAYVYTLTVTDTDGNAATTADVTVTVTNAPETVTLSLTQADGSVAENVAYTSPAPTLTGTPNGGVSYSLGGADALLFTVDTTSGVVSMVAQDFEAPADADSDNAYVYTLTVTDTDGNAATTADVTVTVTNAPETVTLSLTQADGSVAENVAYTSPAPTLTGTPNGGVSYSLGGADALLFTVDTTSGVVSMVAQDFEAPADADSDNAYVYTLTVTDTDGNAATTADVTVTVTNAPETVTLSLTQADGSVAENVAYTSPAPIVTGTPNGGVSYSLGGADALLFTVDWSTGFVSMVARDFEAPVDADSNNAYVYTLTVTDEDGNAATTADVTVTVTNAPETVTLSLTQADGSVAENVAYTSPAPIVTGTPNGGVSYSLGGADAPQFTVDWSTGVVSMVARDFDVPADADGDNAYVYTLTVTDEDGNTATTADVTLTVTNVVETVTLSLAQADGSVVENVAYTSPAPTLTGGTPIGVVVYSLGGADAPQFTVDTSTGFVSMVARDFEVPADADSDNAYVYTLTVTDADGNTGTTADVTVTVTNVVETVTLSLAQADGSVAENVAYTSPAPTLTGGTPIGRVNYTLGGVDAQLFTVDASTGVVSMVARNFEAPADADSNNAYVYTLTVTDTDGNTATTADVTVRVTDAVETVTLSLAQADGSVVENAAYTSPAPTLTGGTPIGRVNYTLGGVDAQLFSVVWSTGVVSMVARDFEAPVDADSDNAYVYTLTVTDTDGNTATTADVTVTVTDAPETATISLAQADGSVAENVAYTSPAPTLTGTPIGAVSYTLGGADAPQFTVDASTGVVSMAARDFEAPADADSDNAYVYTLTVTDADGNTATTADVTVTVTNAPETATISLAQADGSVAENVAYTSPAPIVTGTPVGGVSYSLGGADMSRFTVDASTGVVSMAAQDFEAPADADSDNAYVYTLTVTDEDGNTATTADVTVTVTNVVETATLSLAQADGSVAENTAYTSPTPTLTGTPIGGVSYSLGGADMSRFTVDASTGVVSMAARDFEAPVDADSNNAYVYTLTVTDADGNAATTADVTVTVTDAPETVTLSLAQADGSVVENAAYTSPTPIVTGTPIGRVNYTLGGADAPRFSVVWSTGVVSMAARDFEAPVDADTNNAYVYTLTVTDTNGNTATTADVTVTVTDVVETVTLSLAQADGSVAENVAYTSPTPIVTGTPIGRVSYSLGGADVSRFSVDASTGVVSMAARDFEAPVDADSDNAYVYTLTVTDEDGNTATTADVTVTVTNVVETVTISLAQADGSVAENTAYTSPTPIVTGTPVGGVSYTLGGTDGQLFTVDASTGVVSMAARDFEAPVDADSDNAYVYTLTVTDTNGNTATESVTVTVTNVVETVTLSLAQADGSVAENTAYTSPTPIVTGTPIGGVSYSLGGADMSRFTVDASTGVVSMVARDFEAPVDADSNNAYVYTLTVTDADGNAATTADVTVTVTDVVETVTLSLAQADGSVAENVAYTSPTPIVTGTPIGGVSYSLGGADMSRFTVDASTGVVSMVARDFEAPVDADSNNAYVYTLTVTDADGNAATTADVTVTVTDVVETVTLSLAQADGSVAENTAYTSPTPIVTGTPIGGVSYSLGGADMSRFTVDASTGVVSMVARDFEAPVDADSNNAYVYTLTVTDADGNAATTADVTVTVTDVVETVTLSLAQADGSVAENVAYTSPTPIVTGTPIGGVSYSLGGADMSRFTVDASTGVVSMVARDFEAPVDADSNNAYVYTLTVTDADGNAATTADVTVTVTDVVETVTLSLAQADGSVAENTAYTSPTPIVTGTPVGGVSYTLGGTDGQLFTVDASTGVVSMAARDFEAPVDADSDNAYVYTLTVTDTDGNTGTTADVTVRVTDAVETVTLSLAQADGSVAENTAYTSPTPIVTGTPVGGVSYTLGGTDGQLFTVDASTGVVSMAARDFEAPVDADSNNAYVYTLTVTDADGNAATTADVTVTVTNVVETATLSLAQADGSVAENVAYTSPTPIVIGTPIGGVSYSLGGTDGQLFTVDASTGVVSMAARDFEAPVDADGNNAYVYTLTVTDTDGNTGTTADVTVRVTDAVETVTLSLAQADGSVAENVAYTSQAPIVTGTPIGGVSYSLGGTDGQLFTVDASTGVVSMAARDFEAPVDADSNNAYVYTLTVTDTDGNTGTTADVTVRVTDAVETVTLSLAQADGSVAENVAYTSQAPIVTGTPIGGVSYSLGGTDGQLFTVDASTGVVSMAARDFEAPVDADTNNAYVYTLTVTDTNGNTATTADVTVTVTDVIEAATISLAQADGSVAENTAYTSPAPIVTGTPIGGVSYSLGGADMSRFTVDASTGVVSMVARDFEAPVDADSNNAYVYTLTVTDADGNTATTADVTVTVTDVVETVTLSLAQADGSVAENTAYTSPTPIVTGTPIGGVSYSLGGADMSRFTVDASTGVVSMVARDFEAPVDADTNNAYVYTLTVTDTNGNTATTADVTVTVTDASETATLSLAQADGSVAENVAYTSQAPIVTGTPIGGVSYSLGGTDAPRFTVDTSTGIVSMVARDFEVPVDADSNNAYVYTLTVTDTDGNTGTTSDVTVTVTDAVETVTLSLAQADGSVAENTAYTSPAPTLTGGTPIGRVNYSLGGTDGQLFTVDASTGVVSMVARDFEAPVDADSNNAYVYTLTVTDADGNAATTADVTVTVTDVVETVTLSLAQADGSVAENVAYTSQAPIVTGTPIGGVSYSLGGTDAPRFTVDTSTGIVSMVARDFEVPVDADSNNAYVYTLTVTDTDGNTATTADVTVTVTDVVETVTLSLAQADGSVAENTAYTSPTPTLTGTPIGAVSYSLGGTDGQLFTVDASTGVVSMAARDFEAPVDADSNNAYVYTLTVTDADGNTATTADVTVTVTDVVETVTLSLAQADGSVAENTAYTSPTPTLTGTPIGAVSYSLGGADMSRFTVDASTGVVSMVARDFEAPVDADSNNAYVYTLTVTDADGNAATTADVTVTVTDVVETVTLSLAQADGSVAENTAYTSPTPIVTGTPIGGVSYSLGGADMSRFTVDASTGVVSMAARDFEVPADADGNNAYVYTLTVTDADGNAATTADVTVTVTDVVETVTLSLAQADGSVAENTAYTSPTPIVTGTPIGGVSYSLGGADMSRFTVDASTGVVSMVARDFEAPVDADSNNAYVYTLTVTDADGNAATTADVTVTVTDVVETVTLSLAQADGSVAENTAYTSPTPIVTGTPIGGVSYSLGGADMSRFTVDASTGVVSMVARDFEVPADADGNNAYVYTLTVTDADGNAATTADVTVTVTDVVETVTLSLAQADGSVAENTAYTSPTPIVTGTPIGGVSYSLGGADMSRFTVDASTGVVSMVARDFEAPVDADSNNAYVYTLTVTDADGNAATTADVTVTVTDVVETVTLSLAQADGSVAENTAYTSPTPIVTGTPIGGVSYSLGGADMSRFTVDASTGVVSMVARDFEVPADADGNNAYVYTLTVTDADGNAATTADVTVTVTDVVETVTLSLAQADGSVAENTAYTSPTPIVTGTPIGGVSYSLGGADGQLFTVDASTGVVSMAARDFEAPVDADTNNAYVYTLTVTDADGNTATTADVTVTVTDVVETVTLSLAQADGSVAENVAYTSPTPIVTGTPIGGVSYSLGGADMSRFTVDASTGVVSMVARDFEAPVDADSNNAYVYTLTVTDTDGNTGTTADVTVRVTDAVETVTLSLAQADGSVAENVAYTSQAPIVTGTPIGGVSYSLGGTDAPRFTVDTSTGIVSMVARDFEVPADADGNNAYVYTLTVTDTDGNTGTTADVTVRVTDAVETVTLSLAQADGSVAENVAYTSPAPIVTGTPIGGVSYSLGGADMSRFTVDASTGVVSMVARDFEAPVDADTNNAYVYTLTVTDADGNTATESVTVTVTDVIEAATISLAQADGSVAENVAYTSPAPIVIGTPIGGVSYTLGGTDGQLFTVDASTGVVSMAARDFEVPVDADSNNAYVYTLTVTDTDGNTGTTSDVTVTVTNAPETVTLSLTQADGSVAENAVYTSQVPTLTGTPVGAVSYILAGVDASQFTVDASTGVVSMVAQDFEAPADADGNNAYVYTLTVTDVDGNTATTQVVTVTVTDVIEAATLSLAQAGGSVAENVAYTSQVPTLTGTPIGGVRYSLGGADAPRFSMDTSTGVVSMAARDFEVPVDADTNNAYVYTLTVTDADGNTATTADVTVTVTDASETATISLAQADGSVAENVAYTSLAPTLTGTPIGVVSYTLGGVDGQLFTVDASTGVVSMVARDFEAPVDADSNNAYVYTLTVTDADGNAATTADVTVTVTSTAVVSEADPDKVARQALTTDTVIETANSVVANIRNQINIIRTGGGSSVQGLPQPQSGGGAGPNGDVSNDNANFSAASFHDRWSTWDDENQQKQVKFSEFLSGLKFHVSLNSMFDAERRRLSAAEDGLTPATIPSGPSSGDDLSDVGTLTLWGVGSWTNFENKRNNATVDSRYKGDIFTYTLGSDYRFTQELAAGLAVSLSTADIDTTFNRGTFEEETYLFTPYLSYATEDFSLSLVGGYGVGNVDLSGNETTATTFTANTGTTTLFIQGSIQNIYQLGEDGALELTPKLSVLGAQKTLDAYTDSIGQNIAETTSTVLRLTPELRVGHRHDFEGGSVTPYLRGGIILDFKDTANDDNGAYNVGGGFTIKTDDGFIASLDYEREIGRDDFERQTLTGSAAYGIYLSPYDTVTPTIRFNHDQERGMFQFYGIGYKRQWDEHRFDMGFDVNQDETQNSKFGSSMGYTWSPHVNATLTGTLRSLNLQAKDYEARIDLGLKF